MFISKKRYELEKKHLLEEILELERKNRKYRKKIEELREKLQNKIEVAYNYAFPQKPNRIIVSPYIYEKFLSNRTRFVPRYPFPGEEYEGLDITVDEKLEKKNKYRVYFEAEWIEPPVICKYCGEKKPYELAYPKDNPNFCNELCFDIYLEMSEWEKKK